MYFDRRSVPSHFWADYHLGGSKRGGLGGSDCNIHGSTFIRLWMTDGQFLRKYIYGIANRHLCSDKKLSMTCTASLIAG